MPGNLGHSFPPGLSTPRAPFSGGYDISWSVYIRCANRRKLREVHLPALDAILREPYGARTWHVVLDDNVTQGDPHQHRIVAIEKLKGPYDVQYLVSLMTRLYAFTDTWHITARLDPAHPLGVYVWARTSLTQQHEPPAIVDVSVELEADFSELDPTRVRIFGRTRPIRSP